MEASQAASRTRSPPWWQRGVIYQIYPRSFADTDGDGVGDLEGIRRRVGYLHWLGVDAVWLSPIYPSPMADFGYDVADYCDVDPAFGTLADLDRLLDELHARGMRLILDWVPNHTSDRHPWFVESRSSRDNPKRGWYVWRDPAGTPGDLRPPNNWTQAFRDAPAWTYDEATGQHYLHLFLPEQPDLNWANPEVERAMHDVLRFWLDRGVDGFRADVIHLIGKDPTLPDDPPDLLGSSRVGRHHEPDRTHALLRRIRGVLEEYPGERMMVGEVNLSEHNLIASYYDRGAGLHLAFNFVPLATAWDAGAWRGVVGAIEASFGKAGAWPTWVLSNHDVWRHRSRYGDSEARACAAAVLLLTLRGTPFLYAGEELGLADAAVPSDRVVDPGGRDGCRAPIPWEAAVPHGWASEDPWLPWPPEAEQRNAERLAEDPGSILQLYRLLLTRRRASPALQLGSLELLDAPDGVLAYARAHGRERRVVLVNFSAEAVQCPLERDWTVDVASDRCGEGRPYPGLLEPDQAVVLC